MEKIFPLFFIITFTSSNYIQVEEMLNCFNHNQYISLSNTFLDDLSFTLTMWVRATKYHNDYERPFLRIQKLNTSQSTNIKTRTTSLSYQVIYNNDNLGDIWFNNTPLNTLEENDFVSGYNRYLNWNFFAISFKYILLRLSSSVNFYVKSNVSDTYSTGNKYYAQELNIFPCLSIDENNLGGLYFSDVYIYDSSCSSISDFENKKIPQKILGIYLFNENSAKNRFFIPNQLNGQSKPIKVKTYQPDYPFQQTRFKYSLALFRKLILLNIDDSGLTNNSYLCIFKFNIERVNGISSKFLLYGRADQDLDILQYLPDKFGFIYSFHESFSFDLTLTFNNLVKNTFSSSFSNNSEYLFYFKVTNQIHLSDYNKGLKFIDNRMWQNGSMFYQYTFNTPDYTIFRKTDQHYFGLFQASPDEIVFFNIKEYSIFKDIVNYTSDYVQSNNFITRSNVYNQRRFEVNNTINLVYNTANSSLSDYCSKNCCKCDPETRNCISCFNRNILDANFTCTNNCLNTNCYDSYLEQCYSNMTLIAVNYIGNSVDPQTLTNIRTNIFNRIANEGVHFIIIIKLSIQIQVGNTVYHDITFVTSRDTYLNVNSFDNYFPTKPVNFIYTWEFYYKQITPSSYSNIDIVGKCNNQNYFYHQATNNKGTCSSQCSSGYYGDSNNICRECPLNCLECDLNGCIVCKSSHKNIFGNCVSVNVPCIISNPLCIDCNVNNNNLCTSCVNNTTLLNRECLSNSNCRMVDSRCSACDVDDETKCVSCITGFTALGGVCLPNSNCRIVDSRCSACDVDDETKCVSCITGFTALGGVCLPNSNCRIVDSRCSACDVDDETKCVSCITGFTALGGVCLPNSNCRIVDSRCSACDVDDETKCVSCITGFTALGGVCLPNSNCRVVDSRCSACDVDDETKCVSCITGFTALGGVCLPNSNCRVVDSRCSACDVDDETKCVSCITGFTALGGVCLSNSNCRVVDSRCSACDVDDETKCVSCITGFTALAGVCLPNSNCRIVDSRCSACDVDDETKCVSCITGFTALGGVCLPNSNCRIVDSRCSACDVDDETKCVSCITGFTALGGVCLPNSNCRVVDSRCSACDVDDETKCVSCITGFTALGGVCLPNSNCRVVDSRCSACDVDDETKCVSCITGFTALGGVCLPNSNCRVVDSRCSACDVDDETKCVSCITGFTALAGVCLPNSNCRIVDSRCSACDVDDETKCVSCITGFTALGGVCLPNSNCRVVDSRCSACDVDDETKCVSCITGFTALAGVCLPNSNCRIVDSRCSACDVDDETKCVSCQEKYILYKQECILDICPTFGNCLICNYDLKICDKCEDNYFYDFDIKKCTKIDCPVNCKTCSQYKCFECENGYETFYENCIDSNCYTEFCSSCSLKLIKGCESCFECDNLKFMDGLILNCEEYVENCNNCHFKLNDSLKCLDCKNNFIINEEEHQCYMSEQNVFDSFTIIQNNNGFLSKACLNDYYYDIGTDNCYKISFDCEFGCLKCWGDEKNCIECFKIFNKIDNSCLLHNIDLVPNNCEILSNHNLQKFISFRQNNCLKIFNNFTIINEKNVTTYEYNNYRNEKSYEVFSCILNCEIDKNLCMELKGYSLNPNTNQSENCTKIYQELYMIELRNTTNYTITMDINFDNEIICPKNKNQFKETKFFSEDEFKIIINDKLFNFTNTDNCSKIENGNDHLFYDTTSLNDMKEDCIFCQEKNNYFCSWRKECNIECDIEFDSSKNLFINKNFDSIIVFDENLINKAVPLYIKVKFEYQKQKLKFNFLKNEKGFTFILKPDYILKASNCVMRKKTEFKISLPKYYSNFKFLDNIKTSNNPVNLVLETVISLSFYFFFPPHLFGIYLEFCNSTIFSTTLHI